MSVVPTHIFLIPYRDRKDDLNIFIQKVPIILKEDGITNFQFFVIHQDDKKLFNRGMMLNIGFLEVKKRYPNNWRNIQLVCHDVDIYPTKPGVIKYQTSIGKVNHPYGVLRPQFKGTVGGICIIMGEDYFRSGGHPNLYGWGGEDVGMSRRCQARGIEIDESNFINRRTSPYVIDTESHNTVKELKINIICDSRNLKKVLSENSANPVDTISNIIYTVKSENSICENILMLNVDSQTIF